MRRTATIVATFCAAAVVAAWPIGAGAQGSVPVWQKLLRWSGGESSATPVATLLHGHMQMSVRTERLPGDGERAEAIRAAARRVVEHYRDVATAERDGYRPFAPRGILGEEVHYTNHWKAGREAKTFDLERPGSILYKRTATGMVAVGVMYTAKADATPEQLDARLPLSVAVWHRHVHFCGWPSDAPRDDWDGPAARFGFAGSIDTESDCAAAGGYWIPRVLGWMTHVYPFENDPDRVWLGEHMMEMRGAKDEHPSGHAHRHQ